MASTADNIELKETAPQSRQEWLASLERQNTEDKKKIFKICNECGYPVSPLRKDAAGKQWYVCGSPKCQAVTAEPKEIKFNDYMVEGINRYSEGEEGYEKFSPGIFAHQLMDHAFFRTDKHTETVYVYNVSKGIYEPTAEAFIKSTMADKLGADLREHQYRDVLFIIKSNTLEELTESTNKIGLLNGILNLSSLEIENPTPGNFILAQIPVNYDPQLDCPAVKKFLLEVFGEYWLPTIQEYLGYCLYRGMPFHKLLLLVGEGSNGKSKFLALVTEFLGPKNCSSVPLQQLSEDRFTVAQLYGKMANICADLSSNEIRKLGPLKLLTGDDYIYARNLYSKGFNFKNKAKMLFSANAVPQIKEDTDAVFRRLIPVPCNNRFEGASCDPLILTKITLPSELSGLLNYAIEGLKRLLANGRFSNDNGTEAARANYIRQSNSAKAFIEEKLEYTPDANAVISDLYERFVLWCNTERLATVQKRSFTEKMQEHLPQAKQVQRRLLGQRVWVWQFVKFQDTELAASTATQSTLSTQNLQNNNSKEPQSDSVTAVTAGYPSCENEPKKIEVIEAEVTAVTPPSTITGKSNIVHYRRLASHEVHHCEADHNGAKIEAEYELASEGATQKAYYCKEHLASTWKICSDNGFRMVEDQPLDLSGAMDSLDFQEGQNDS